MLLTCTNLDPSQRYSVQFGSETAQAEMLQPGILRCRVPAAAAAGAVPLRVVVGGASLSAAAEDLFTYRT